MRKTVRTTICTYYRGNHWRNKAVKAKRLFCLRSSCPLCGHFSGLNKLKLFGCCRMGGKGVGSQIGVTCPKRSHFAFQRGGRCQKFRKVNNNSNYNNHHHHHNKKEEKSSNHRLETTKHPNFEPRATKQQPATTNHRLTTNEGYLNYELWIKDYGIKLLSSYHCQWTKNFEQQTVGRQLLACQVLSS